ncbi:MAG: hypothetical protein L0271_14710 [Gemmatimonadetes bacterium]|nr:hypothetical protein [Gemmatimonadota bacterium]
MAALWMTLVQAAEELPPLDFSGLVERVLQYLSPYTEYIVILIVFWLFARRGGQKQGDFSRQAQDVLDELYRRGEITESAYEKFRQDISLRPKR